MAVVRWSQWNDLFDVHTQMDHLFQPVAPAVTSTGPADRSAERIVDHAPSA